MFLVHYNLGLFHHAILLTLGFCRVIKTAWETTGKCYCTSSTFTIFVKFRSQPCKVLGNWGKGTVFDCLTLKVGNDTNFEQYNTWQHYHKIPFQKKY